MRLAVVTAGVLLVIFAPGRLSAQGVEVGAGTSFSCRSSDITPCQEVWGRADAVHVSWWRSPSLVLEGRVVHLDGPNHRIVAVAGRTTTTGSFFRNYTVRDEQRIALQGSVIYHFRPARLLRPFIGGGIGSMWWSGEAFCEARQIDCQSVLPSDAPDVSSREWVVSFAGGLAVETGGGSIVRFGVRDTAIASAIFPRGSAALSSRSINGKLPEFFMNVGYRW